jgi:hypothetical protein
MPTPKHLFAVKRAQDHAPTAGDFGTAAIAIADVVLPAQKYLGDITQALTLFQQQRHCCALILTAE